MFVPNLQVTKMQTVTACPSCYNSTIQIKFCLQFKFWMGQMTATIYIKKKNIFCCEDNCAILPLAANSFYGAS